MSDTSFSPGGGALAVVGASPYHQLGFVARTRKSAPVVLSPGGASLNLSGGQPSLGSPFMEVLFSWTAVTGATDYTLQVGTSSGASDYGTFDAGNNLSMTLFLPPGTYYARVVDNFTGTPSAEQGPIFV